MSDFIEECLYGRAEASEVDNFIDQWHESQSDLPIHEFLGMTNKEYSLFVKDENYLEFIIRAHKEKKDIEHILQDKQEKYSRSKRK